MAGDVVLVQLVDRDQPVELVADQTSLDQATLRLATQCKLSPVTTTLFGFRQGTAWLPPSDTLASTIADKQTNKLLQFRLRYKVPGWKSSQKPTKLRNIDEVTFEYFYSQVRRDFDLGLVCSKKLVNEKEQK